MSYFPGVFVSQYHKSRAGYYINHDLLMHGIPSSHAATPETKRKLIFYYIAENTPQKLQSADELEYDHER